MGSKYVGLSMVNDTLLAMQRNCNYMQPTTYQQSIDTTYRYSNDT